MAQQQYQDTPTIGFRSFQLLKTQTLGIGLHGSVCKAQCDDLFCAAKIIHQTLFNPNVHQRIDHHRKHKLPINRFMQECEFMSAIRHPNIVQYLGTCQDPQTGLPVLLMELMDDSLTHFLDSSQDAIHYHIQVKFCHDITLAISYLHSNGITHRDLSSNNVLLCGNVKAKVTDFGMAKLGDINPQATRISFTTCPGTDAYMPPEAVIDKPVYTAKIDCFAIGTLVIQILTKCFPEPGDRLKPIQIDHPQFPGGTVYVRVPEIERRQNHISLVDPNHPLLPIALHCLKDSDVERPSAQELCHRIAALKETPQFAESVRRAQERPEPGNTTEREEEIRELQQQVQDKDEENRQMRQKHVQQIQGLQQIIGSQNKRLQQKADIIQEKEQTIVISHQEYHKLRGAIRDKDQLIIEKGDIIQEKEQTTVACQQECQQLRRTIRDKDQLIEERERQLHHVTQQLESSQQVMAQFQTRIQEQEQQQLNRELPIEVVANPQPRPRDPPQICHSDTSTRTVTRDSFTLWRMEAKKAPCELTRGTNAIVEGDTVYLRAAPTRNIYAYKSTDDTWDQLPDCETGVCTLVVVENLLTTIGGSSGGRVTNQLFSLTGEGTSKKWIEVFKSMPTKRSSSVAVCTKQALIVAGGNNQVGRRLATVEVMDIDTEEWLSAADLPEPLSTASVAICHDRIYLTGGYSVVSGATKSVYTCSLNDLFLSCQSRSLGERLAQFLSLTRPARSTIWDKVADLPVIGSTCVTLHGQLLAIGGSDSKDTPISDVRVYHPTSNTWEVISKMKISRWCCFAAVLPSNKLMVAGGCTTSSMFSKTDSVEIATVV